MREGAPQLDFGILAAGEAAITLHAPAKINLSLLIGERRPDGYHEIRTSIVPLALCDRLTIRGAHCFGLSCSDPALSEGEDNLVVRAVDGFASAAGWNTRPTIAVHLDKAIPHGAGLGGGSSDAAAMLRFLNAGTGALDGRTLERVAADIGSDVPAFLHNGPVTCVGRGEIVTPLGGVPPFRVFLAKPPFGIPTASAYSCWSGRTTRPSACVRGILELKEGRLEMRNDFETVLFPKYVLLPVVRRWLDRQAETEGAMMSGSGSTLFAVLGPGACEESLRRRFLEAFGEDWWVWSGAVVPSPGVEHAR